jgi:lipopolysaccharide export system protein LptC
VPSLRQLFLAGALAVLGLLAWWKQTEQSMEKNALRSAGNQPDYTVNQLTVTTMGEAGHPSRRLVARELRHYPQDAGNELDEPRLTLYKDDEPPWHVRSNLGHVSEDGAEVLLKGPVFADRAAAGETPSIHIKTWELFIQTREQYGRTEHPVHVTSGADWLSSASGAELWFGDKLHLKLFGRARLQFEPNER